LQKTTEKLACDYPGLTQAWPPHPGPEINNTGYLTINKYIMHRADIDKDLKNWELLKSS
jgi:hypothetical protein